MTTTRELPDGTTISHDGTTRHWTLNDGTVLRSDAFGPWVPCIEFPDQTCAACGLEHPGAECAQPDLFGGEL